MRVVCGVGLLVGLVAGCGSSEASGHLSGKVTFNGQPVPKGRIVFLPDGSKGGSGQGTVAEISNGSYDTRPGGTPLPTGALVVRIEGFDGKSGSNPSGKPLFL